MYYNIKGRFTSTFLFSCKNLNEENENRISLKSQKNMIYYKLVK